VTAHRIVFANEKGGTGKSTTAIHVAIALAYQGARVAVVDLDQRQRTLYRYLENRAETERKRGIALPGARFAVFDGPDTGDLDALCDEIADGQDFLIIDTPGRDDPFARHAATGADTLVTPMNDSFVDFDLIGQVDAETFKVRKSVVLCRTDLGSAQEAQPGDDRSAAPGDGLGRGAQPHQPCRGAQHAALERRSRNCRKRVGFRVASGLSERVIYRELFPFGPDPARQGASGRAGHQPSGRAAGTARWCLRRCVCRQRWLRPGRWRSRSA
jgi:chromosome partitioning protein